MKKFLIFLIAFFSIQNLVFANGITCKTSGNKTACSMNGVVVLTATTYRLPSGFVEVQTCTFMCESQIMTPLAAKNYIDSLKFGMWAYSYAAIEGAKEEKRLQKIKEDNKKKITKRVEIVTQNGDKIALEEDKNYDDFLIINKKRERIGHNFASKHEVQYSGYNPAYGANPNFPELVYTDTSLQEIIKKGQDDDIYKKELRTYNQIILDARELGKLFKLVYGLRLNNGVGYNEAQKLMSFGYDNGNYKPEHMILPNEAKFNNYVKEYTKAQSQWENIVFPEYVKSKE